MIGHPPFQSRGPVDGLCRPAGGLPAPHRPLHAPKGCELGAEGPAWRQNFKLPAPPCAAGAGKAPGAHLSEAGPRCQPLLRSAGLAAPLLAAGRRSSVLLPGRPERPLPLHQRV